MKKDYYISVHPERFRFVPVFITLLLFCISECDAQIKIPVGNWGVRFGLNAVSITNYEAYIADEISPSSSYTNKNGYFITTFARFNMNRLFLQPELAWNKYNRVCSFSLPSENSGGYYQQPDLNISSKAINTNFLVGYNIVCDSPFLFGIYTGTAFPVTYRTHYSMGTETPFTKKDLSLNLSGILGFSINISKIYFDLRYEMGLPDAKLNLKNIPSFSEKYNNVKIKKAESIISFSCGIML